MFIFLGLCPVEGKVLARRTNILKVRSSTELNARTWEVGGNLQLFPPVSL